MNVSLTSDLRESVRRKVESGQFPNEQAVVMEALRLFLVEDLDASQADPHEPDAPPETRTPSPFIVEQADLISGDIPRTGRAIGYSQPHGEARRPDLFPGE